MESFYALPLKNITCRKVDFVDHADSCCFKPGLNDLALITLVGTYAVVVLPMEKVFLLRIRLITTCITVLIGSHWANAVKMG